MSTKSRLVPLLLALAVIIGILIGTFFASHFSGNRLSIVNTGSNKLNYLLQIIDNNYVDTVNANDLIENAMPVILSELMEHLRIFYQQKYCKLQIKGTEGGRNKKGPAC